MNLGREVAEKGITALFYHLGPYSSVSFWKKTTIFTLIEYNRQQAKYGGFDFNVRQRVCVLFG
jgi:hypothetical protein